VARHQDPAAYGAAHPRLARVVSDGAACISLTLLPSARDFSAVYDEHVWHVYGFFAYRLRNRSDAEDLTQLTFERALKAWARYDAAKASVGTWLIVIARNLLVDHFRADRSARQQSLDDLHGGHDALVDRADPPDLGLEPDLERALATLGTREREIIALRFGGELSGPEIAEITGLSLANVQQILSRSLRRMRAVIDAAKPLRTERGSETAGS
jgi:RNA polymerase sigma factor (sigma-70 family)